MKHGPFSLYRWVLVGKFVRLRQFLNKNVILTPKTTGFFVKRKYRSYPFDSRNALLQLHLSTLSRHFRGDHGGNSTHIAPIRN